MKKKKQNDEAPLPAREAALRILERTGISAPVQSLLDTKLTGGLFSRQEAALTTELVYGHLRSEIRISWLLSQFMKAPEKLPASMKLMIGIAAYELLYLDRIPAHASVSAAVDAVRARFGQGLSRVANGVLRSLIRLSESEDLKAFAFYESRIKDPMERLSVFHSVPRWMLELWTKGYGPEKAETFARAVSVVPSPCVRVNAARDEWEALRDFLCKEGEAVGISGVRFAPGTQPEYMRDYLRQGRLSIQGAGSQLVLEALDAPRWEGPVWDACAGRGGKTLALVELGVPVLAASDTYQPRLRGMRDDAKRLVLKTPPLFCASAAEPALRGTPRTILLDVPCSGLGTLARHPDLRTLRTPGQVARAGRPPTPHPRCRVVVPAFRRAPRLHHLHHESRRKRRADRRVPRPYTRRVARKAVAEHARCLRQRFDVWSDAQKSIKRDERTVHRSFGKTSWLQIAI